MHSYSLRFRYLLFTAVEILCFGTFQFWGLMIFSLKLVDLNKRACNTYEVYIWICLEKSQSPLFEVVANVYGMYSF